MNNSGILIINKHAGCTSRDIVNDATKCLMTKKIGHTGTLDPMATGVLVLCVNKGLKLCELLNDHDKEYIAGIILGMETETLDTDGNVLSVQDVDFNDEEIKKAVNSFIGSYMQEVPKYSAVKVNGRKLYDYARSNINVELPKKQVTIYDISIVDNIIHENSKIYFKIKCHVSKGTYIRSLIRDIGLKLGCNATMNSLIRTKVGCFSINDAYSINDVRNNNYKLISITDAFPSIKKRTVDDNLAFKVKNGVILDKFFNEDMAFLFDNDGNLLALYKNDNNKSRAYKMFV